MHDMQREQSLPDRGITRRSALRLIVSGGSIAVLAAVAAATPTIASAAAPILAQASSTDPGTLNVALSDLATENLDTILAAPNLNVVPLIYEPLLQYDQQGNLVPWLAESW